MTLPFRRGRLAPTALAALAVLAACGGSGGGDGTVATTSVATLPAEDGHVVNVGFVETNGGTGIAVGDNASDLVARGFLRFSLASIPAGATIRSAELAVYQDATVFGTPYDSLGDLVVDHLDLGATLDFPDYDSVALDSAFGVLSDAPVPETKTLDVTAQVAADVAAGRTTSDYRLRFETETDFDAGDDSVRLNDAEGSLVPGRSPTLTVTYRTP